jgi:hypothetical protein
MLSEPGRGRRRTLTRSRAELAWILDDGRSEERGRGDDADTGGCHCRHPAFQHSGGAGGDERRPERENVEEVAGGQAGGDVPARAAGDEDERHGGERENGEDSEGRSPTGERREPDDREPDEE